MTDVSFPDRMRSHIMACAATVAVDAFFLQSMTGAVGVGDSAGGGVPSMVALVDKKKSCGRLNVLA